MREEKNMNRVLGKMREQIKQRLIIFWEHHNKGKSGGGIRS